MFEGARDWCYRHRAKLGGAAVLAGVAGYLWYNPEQNPLSSSFGQSEPERSRQAVSVEDGEWQLASSRSSATEGSAAQKASTQRSRILLRIRKEFATQAVQFLPLLQTKILRAVDFDHAYDQLKELKRQRSAAVKAGNGAANIPGNPSLDSNQLWEQIKDSTFTYLFVISYVGSVMCVLMRIQLHIQARMLIAASSGSSARGEKVDIFEKMDTEAMKTLVNRTYTPLYGEGLTKVTALVRSHVTAELRDWAVCDTSILVEYQHLARRLSAIRRACETDFPALLRSMCLVPISEQETPELNHNVKVAAGAGSSADDIVSSLLAQTWDVVDSPLFTSVCTEAFDTCFRRISGKLRDKVFVPTELQDITGGSQPRTPPLASILPTVKSIAKEMLPAGAAANAKGTPPAGGIAPSPLSSTASSGAMLTAEVRDIAAGAALDSLCTAVFDATTSTSS